MRLFHADVASLHADEKKKKLYYSMNLRKDKEDEYDADAAADDDSGLGRGVGRKMKGQSSLHNWRRPGR